MRKEIVRTTFIRMLIIMLTGSFLPLRSQSTEQIFQETYAVEQGSKVWISHQRGLLRVEKSPDNQLHLELKVRITGEDKKEVDLLLSAIQIEATKKDPELKIKTETGIVNWNETNGKTRIKLKSGPDLQRIQNLEMVLVAKVPMLAFLELANKYQKIEITEVLAFHTSIDIYSGEVSLKEVKGDLDIKSKYSTINFDNFHLGNFDLYESKALGGASKKAVIQSKYSTVKLLTSEGLTINSYEDKYTLGDIKGVLVIDDKYSDYEIANFENAKLQLYETHLQMKSGQHLMVDSKYGEVRGNQVKTCVLSETYETDFEFEQVEDLTVNQDKYGAFRIGTLLNRIKLSGYESMVEISQVHPSFSEIWINSKYDHMRFGLPAKLSYSLDVDLKYGSLSFHDGIFATVEKTEKGENLVVKAGKNASAKIYLRGYETDFVLK